MTTSNPETDFVNVKDPLVGGVVGFEIGEGGEAVLGSFGVDEPEHVSEQPRTLVSQAMTALPCEAQFAQQVAS